MGTSGIQYHLRELLGEGGQGWVYKANYDDPDGFWMVVKMLRPEGIDADALKRFEREAEVLRMLGSAPNPNPNIVRFYDYGVQSMTLEGEELSLPFIALEYVDGPTLGRVIEAHGGFGLPVIRVRRLMKQVARALHMVHERRIVHRDLKPSNILLTQIQEQEVAKVTDFGLVKLPELSGHKTFSIAGASLGYAPPEQYEMGNSRVTVQTDVFSFAAILFEMLSGHEAYPYTAGDNPLRIVARMLRGDLPALARVSATVPRELRDRPDLTAALDLEIARAISPDPTQRHATIRELWEKVEPLLREASSRGAGEDRATFEPGVLGYAFGSPSGSAVSAPPLHPGSDAPAGAALDRGSSPLIQAGEGGVYVDAYGNRYTPLIPSSSQPGRSSAPQPPPRTPPPAPAVQPAAPTITTSNAAAPEWRMVGRPMTGERLRSGLISGDGRTIIAVGAHGLYHFAQGVWSALHLPSKIDPRFLRGLRRMPKGELLLYGDSGFVMTLSTSGVTTRVDVGDTDLSLLGAHADAHGVALAGERLSRPVGALVELPVSGPHTVRTVDGTRRLHAVTRINPDALVVCGTHGDLIEIQGKTQRDIVWGRTGHLYALASRGQGTAYAVGSGGHALVLTKTGADVPVALLEVVQTTRDITFVVASAGGWAVGAQARLLQRKVGGEQRPAPRPVGAGEARPAEPSAAGVWTRISLDPIAQGQLVAVGPRADGLTVLGEDGVVLEGRGLA